MEFALLRVLHIFLAMFWAGSVIYSAAFLFPAVKAAGKGNEKFILRLSTFNKLPMWLALSSIITILVGLRMLYILSGGYTLAFFGTNYGISLLGGALCAIVAFIIGFTVNRPIGVKLDKLSKEIPEGQEPNQQQINEAQALFQKMGAALKIIAFLLSAAIILMVIAKYI